MSFAPASAVRGVRLTPLPRLCPMYKWRQRAKRERYVAVRLRGCPDRSMAEETHRDVMGAGALVIVPSSWCSVTTTSFDRLTSSRRSSRIRREYEDAK